jgi:quinol monooxygenase YgiN
MAVFKVARYEIRPDKCTDAERAMHDLASYVRKELPGSSWTTYRDPHAPAHYLSLSRADDRAADDRHHAAPGVHAFLAALRPLLVGALETTEYELVTSSDLAPRLRTPRRPR